MRLPNWFKIAWWILLLCGNLILVLYRLGNFINGTANNIDALLFIIFIILLLLPIFQEFDIFGIKLKSQIAELKSDIKEQVLSLRTDINSIGVNTQVNPQIYFTPPPDSLLPDIENKFRKILADTLKNQSIQSPIDIQTELVIPHNVNYLFLIRYTIEKELRRIWRDRFQKHEDDKFTPIYKITQALSASELLEPRISNIIREVYSICSPAIHGESVSDRQIAFVKDIGPELITALMSIK